MAIPAVALATITGFKAISNITSTKEEKMPQFFYGGSTGSKGMYQDEFGGVTGVVHEDEWVAPKFMTESPKYAQTFQYLESERKRGLGQFYNGGRTSTPDISFTSDSEPSTPTNNVSMAVLLDVMLKLNDKLDQGFKGYIVRDMEEFQRQKELDNEYERILKNTRQS